LPDLEKGRKGRKGKEETVPQVFKLKVTSVRSVFRFGQRKKEGRREKRRRFPSILDFRGCPISTARSSPREKEGEEKKGGGKGK